MSDQGSNRQEMLTELETLAAKIDAVVEMGEVLNDELGDNSYIDATKFIKNETGAKIIGKRVSKVRKALSSPMMTQQELAQKSNVDQSIISKIENGNLKAMAHLYSVSRALDIKLSWMLTGQGEIFLDPLKSALGQAHSVYSLLDSALNEENTEKIDKEKLQQISTKLRELKRLCRELIK
ncbi:helix-turn-helix domain-containing protein [Vibrio alginolyticus]|uniref:helix-turn-helix domain-containing protein n=1 Tax=Vibrio alginolyticus TaxID=663 RepID=UPI002119F87B|nr:helix-turn-helix transcriptional regulator [Vibrio alginolyticus]MCQ9090553.1 helix-turn-helix transcriptional regulator [Vibrio alginolyticus]